jgi:hypothetical protein
MPIFPLKFLIGIGDRGNPSVPHPINTEGLSVFLLSIFRRVGELHYARISGELPVFRIGSVSRRDSKLHYAKAPGGYRRNFRLPSKLVSGRHLGETRDSTTPRPPAGTGGIYVFLLSIWTA